MTAPASVRELLERSLSGSEDQLHPIARNFADVLQAAKDIEDNLIAEGKCPKCTTELIHESGCKYCSSCGWSACGN